MTQRIGLLSVAMAALGVAVTGFYVQGAGASSLPVEVASFATAPSAVASIRNADEYDVAPSDDALFHATAANAAKPCNEGAGLATLRLTAEVGVVCMDSNVLGYLVTVKGHAPKIVQEVDLAGGTVTHEACPSVAAKQQPDA